MISSDQSLPELKCVEFFSQRPIMDESSTSANGLFINQTIAEKQAYLKALDIEHEQLFMLPCNQRRGKFIQVTLRGHYYPNGLELVAFMPFNPENNWYHAAILRELLVRLHIEGGFPNSYTHLNNYEYCDYDSDVLTVKGGGFYEIDEPSLLLTLSGKSTAYGAYPKKRLRQLFDRNRHCFSDFQLVQH